MAIKHHIPFALIQECIDNDQLNTLYYYYKLRQVFKNRVVYNFTHAKGAKLLGLSKAASHKHVRLMIEKGWCTLEHGNLRILGINALLKTFKCKALLQVPIAETRKKQIIIFRYAIIYRNLRLQLKKANTKSEIVRKCKIPKAEISKYEYKLIKKAGGSENLERTWQHRTTLSNRTIGKKLNRSQKSGANYQKQFRENELIWSIKSHKEYRKDVSGGTWAFLLHYANDRCNVGLTSDNRMVSQQSNTLIPRMNFQYQIKSCNPLALVVSKKQE